MNKINDMATRDRRKAYRNPITDGERLCIAIVFGLMGFVSAWFWLGVTA